MHHGFCVEFHAAQVHDDPHKTGGNTEENKHDEGPEHVGCGGDSPEPGHVLEGDPQVFHARHDGGDGTIHC